MKHSNVLGTKPENKPVKIQDAVNKYRELGITGIHKAPTLYFCNICGTPVTEEQVIKKDIDWSEETYGLYCDPEYIEDGKKMDKPLIGIDMGSTRHEYFFCSKRCGVIYKL